MHFISNIAAAQRIQVPEWYSARIWTFNAVSDDGSEALCISFIDPLGDKALSPVVELVYSVKGHARARSYCELAGTAVEVSERGCVFGRSRFNSDDVEYGGGYLVELDLSTALGDITAHFEWLAVESDVIDGIGALNVATPRADVTGKIVRRARGREKVFQFRGTGWHSFSLKHASEPPRFTGCVHFVDRTAVIDSMPDTAFALCVADETAVEHILKSVRCRKRLSMYGLRYPAFIEYESEGMILRLEPRTVIDSRPFSIRTVNDVTLRSSDGKVRRSAGIFEFTKECRRPASVFEILASHRKGRSLSEV
ncbi:MAG: hypothetical protein HS105_07025 [Chloracidobacterium sp.]|nr:hypothetical protein [Chloracidobacterium sp.]MCC6824259.1 hypothetical protein [Acidobacteriota bacterium]MCO5334376.1 hypothetical protein [Pyrinomonadaceae bacterium]